MQSNFSYPMVRAMEAAQPAGVEVFAFTFLRGVSVAVGDRPAFLAGGALADGRFFTALDVQMELGRSIAEVDDVQGAPLVAVLSHAFWMRAFGGDPAAVGSTVRVNGNPVEVIGVTIEGFQGLSLGGYFPQSDITVPVGSQPRIYPRLSSLTELFTAENHFWLRVMARVDEGVSEPVVEQALQAAMLSVPSPLHPDDGAAATLRLIPGSQGAQPVRAETGRLLYVLLGVVGWCCS